MIKPCVHPWSSRRTTAAIALAVIGGALATVAGCAKAIDDEGSGKGSASACRVVDCGAACSESVPCSTGTHCGNDGTCTADCASDSDCPSGNVCQKNAGLCSVFANNGGSGNSITNPSGATSGTLPPSQGGIQEVDPSVPRELAANACSGWATELETVPAVLEFVLDTSYSMAEKKVQGTTWNLQGQGQTKWQITHDALVSAIDGLGADVAAGIVFFPNHAIISGQRFTQEQDPSACFNPSNRIGIDLMGASGSAHRTELTNGLNGIQPNGNTPTYEAYYYAVTQMLEANQFEGQKYMVLLTDGVPTFGKGCTGTGQEQADNIIPTDPIIGLIQSATEVGINTFVIGAPGSQDGIDGADARPWLSAAARAGKTAPDACSDNGSPRFCHMDMTQAADFGAELRSGLGVITSQLGSCQYGMPEPPPGESIDVNQLNVFVSNSGGTFLILPSTESACTEGWRIVDGKIELCPDSCNRAESDPGARVQILAGCTTAEVIENIPLL